MHTLSKYTLRDRKTINKPDILTSVINKSPAKRQKTRKLKDVKLEEIEVEVEPKEETEVEPKEETEVEPKVEIEVEPKVEIEVEKVKQEVEPDHKYINIINMLQNIRKGENNFNEEQLVELSKLDMVNKIFWILFSILDIHKSKKNTSKHTNTSKLTKTCSEIPEEIGNYIIELFNTFKYDNKDLYNCCKNLINVDKKNKNNYIQYVSDLVSPQLTYMNISITNDGILYGIRNDCLIFAETMMKIYNEPIYDFNTLVNEFAMALDYKQGYNIDIICKKNSFKKQLFDIGILQYEDVNTNTYFYLNNMEEAFQIFDYFIDKTQNGLVVRALEVDSIVIDVNTNAVIGIHDNINKISGAISYYLYKNDNEQYTETMSNMEVGDCFIMNINGALQKKTDKTNSPYHAGFCYKVDNNFIYTIEDNAGFDLKNPYYDIIQRDKYAKNNIVDNMYKKLKNYTAPYYIPTRLVYVKKRKPLDTEMLNNFINNFTDIESVTNKEEQWKLFSDLAAYIYLDKETIKLIEKKYREENLFINEILKRCFDNDEIEGMIQNIKQIAENERKEKENKKENKEKNEVTLPYEPIHTNISSSVVSIKPLFNETESKIIGTESKIIDTHNMHIEPGSRKDSPKSEINDLNSEINDLNREIKRLNSEINKLKSKINRTTKKRSRT